MDYLLDEYVKMEQRAKKAEAALDNLRSMARIDNVLAARAIENYFNADAHVRNTKSSLYDEKSICCRKIMRNITKPYSLARVYYRERNGRVHVIKTTGFLTKEGMVHKYGENVYNSYISSFPHMFYNNIREVVEIFLTKITGQEIGVDFYSPETFYGSIVRMKDCGARLSKIIKEDRMLKKEQERSCGSVTKSGTKETRTETTKKIINI